MMGRLTERDRELIGRAIEGIATSDVGQIQDVVMALGEFREKPDQSCLYDDISNLLSQYGTMDLGEIDVAEVMMSLMEVMMRVRSGCRNTGISKKSPTRSTLMS